MDAGAAGPLFPASPRLSGGWSLPGEWPDRRAPAPDQPTLALPDSCRAVPSEPPRDLFAGWRRYRSPELVGVGGMGRVYRAREPRTGRTVALKFLVDAAAGRGHREAALQGRVRHPGVLPVLDHGELHHYPWFAMPFVEGRTFKAARPGLGLTRAVALVAEVARIVEAVHAAGVVHCDLNPRNLLLVRPEGTAGGGESPRVIDFGIAREMDEPARGKGRVVGTPAYMAPEQALGRRHQVDARTDVYALGATLYELVSGRRPFAADTCEAIITKAIHEAPEPLHALNADVPPALERVVLRCLEKDPRDRYPTAAALAGELESCLAC